MPGIYKRGGKYAVPYRDPARAWRSKSAPTMAAAKLLKQSLATDLDRGEWRAQSSVTFAKYWGPWIDNLCGPHVARLP